MGRDPLHELRASQVIALRRHKNHRGANAALLFERPGGPVSLQYKTVSVELSDILYAFQNSWGQDLQSILV